MNNPTGIDDYTEEELRQADLLERALEQFRQGRSAREVAASLGACGTAADPDNGTLRDLTRVLRLIEGLHSQQSQYLTAALLGPEEAEAPTQCAGDASGNAEATNAVSPPAAFHCDFRIRRRLGGGVFGTVWLADDLRLDRPVALKQVNLPDARHRRILRDEAKALAAVDHRHVVRVYDCRESPADGAPYLVLQYVEGCSLAERVAREGPLHWRDAARLVAEVGEGLLAVHARGIVHRDVKPANLLWSADRDEALLTDFGISARLSDNGTVGGTPSYMPPEAFTGTVGPAQDVYALAATLFWLVTGSTPYPGPSRAALAEQARRGVSLHDPRWAALPARLEETVRRGLAAEVSRRSGLSELVTALRANLNQALTDGMAGLAAGKPGEVVRLLISRRTATGSYASLTASRGAVRGRLRDVQLVPEGPESLLVRTGDRLRIEVEVTRPGHVSVFNVGPTGNLNRLCPAAVGAHPTPINPGPRLRIGETLLTPPTGPERLVAVWSRRPLTVRLEDVLGQATAPAPARATRDIALLEESVAELAPDDWHVAVVELDHQPEVSADKEE
ncbi:MAG: serine/threonine-protein kinase [Gemmataceae bacterium]